MLTTMHLSTPRLRLVPYEPPQLRTLVEAPERFADTFGCPAAAGLRDCLGGAPDAAWRPPLGAGDDADPWQHGFAVVHRERDVVIGHATYAGPPDARGVVEIACAVVPSYAGEGHATEAVGALVEHALADPRVRVVRAHTRAEPGPAPAILGKLGFALVGEIVDAARGLVWRWERRAPLT